MSGSKEEDLRKRALCIIAAKPEELAVFHNRFRLTEHFTSSNIPGVSYFHEFWLGSFLAGNGQQLPFYLTCCSRQGIQTFSIESTALFIALKPKYAIHVGVCAGMASKGVKVGDVIFGQTALNYEEGKHVLKDNARIFQPSADVIRRRDVGVAAFVKDANQPKYKYGTFASGCSVRTDAQEILQRVADTIERDVLALEMEASAFLHVCEHTGVISLGVVKGVSDLGDENKVGGNDDTDYNAALINTATAVQLWIGATPDTITPLPREREPGLVLAEGYCINYIGPVWDMKDELWTKTGKIEGKAEGVKIVLPNNNDVTEYDRANLTIKNLIRRKGLLCVCTGEGHDIRTTFYKAPFIFDFPRNVATLATCSDVRHQLDLFAKHIRDKSSTKWEHEVEVWSWQEFQTWAKDPTPSTSSPNTTH